MLGAAQMLQGNHRKDNLQATVNISCNSSFSYFHFSIPSNIHSNSSIQTFKLDRVFRDCKDLQNSVGGPALLSHLVKTVSASYAGRIELHDDRSKQALAFLLYSLITCRCTILKLNQGGISWDASYPYER